MRPLWHKDEHELKALFFQFSNQPTHRTNRQLHSELLGQLLRRCLDRRDYCRAFKIYSQFVNRISVTDDFMWKIGCEFLGQKEEYESLCVRFLQLLFLKSPIHRKSILLETALYQLRFGRLMEARDTLEPYVDRHPYDSNPLIVGYGGVIEFSIWIKKLREKRQQQKYDDSNGDMSDVDQNSTTRIDGGGGGGGDDGEGDGHDDNHKDDMDDDDDGDDWLEEDERLQMQISRHHLLAGKRLERSLKMDNKNDMFLTYLVRLKCGKVNYSGLVISKPMSKARKAAIYNMKNYLKKFYNNNNDSLLALWLLAALENRERRQTLDLILKQDPAANWELYIQPLVNLMIQSLPDNIQTVIMDVTPPPPPPSRNITKGSKSRKITTLLHGMDVTCLYPIIQLLLTRAEFGVLSEWEEEMIIKICDL
ncbi:hypothetical protein BGZ65_007181, partial [Modicella reniformis]